MKTRLRTVCSLVCPVLVAVLSAATSRAAPLVYSGRLVDANGAPLEGEAELEISFFDAPQAGNRLGNSPYRLSTTLEQGVFHLDLNLNDADRHAIFHDSTGEVWIAIRETKTDRLYPRQRFGMVPFALKIPVDGETLIFSADGKLTLQEISIGQVTGLEQALNQQASSTSSGLLSQTDWQRFNDKEPAITTQSLVNAGAITTDDQGGIVLKPFGTQPAQTGEIRFAEVTGPNYVGFKAATSITNDQIWTLPATDGTNGQMLTTNGSGVLSWGSITGDSITSGTIGGTAKFSGSGGIETTGPINAGTVNINASDTGAAELRLRDADNSNFAGLKSAATLTTDIMWTLPNTAGGMGHILKTDGQGNLYWESPGGGGDMFNSSNLFDLTDKAAARTNLQLGSLSTASSVTSTMLASGAINDSHIASSAAISTTKIQGPLTAISGHGLGSLAARDSVSTAEINDFTITNADIASNAAIATDKLAGALTNIAGNGLGSLATLDSIGNSQIATNAAIATSKLNGPITGITGHGLGGLATLDSIANSQVAANAAIATSKLNGPLTSITGHGLGGLATLDSIVNANIASNAAIATSKLTGPITSISGHGLGSLATATTILNADVAGNAAISTTKISGPLTAISAHGLGALATASTVNDTLIASNAAISTNKLSGSILAISGHGLGNLATATSISSAQIADSSITDADIAGSAAISVSKIMIPSDSISGDKVDGGTVSNFASTGIDDNASSIALTISAAGNIGIGTTSPAGLLDVNGALTVLSGGSVGIGTATPDPGNMGVKAMVSDGSMVVRSPKSSLLRYGGAGSGFTNISTLSLWYNGAYSDTIDSMNASGGSITFGGAYHSAGYENMFAGIRGAKESTADQSSNGYLSFHTYSQSAVTMVERVRVSSTGNVGIGTTTPLTKLQVNGQAASVTASIASLNVDFDSGNIQSNSVAAGTLVLNNMVDGASYTLVLTNASGGNYVLSGSGVSTWRCTPSCASNTVTVTAGSHTVLSLFKIGTTGYVSWLSL